MKIIPYNGRVVVAESPKQEGAIPIPDHLQKDSLILCDVTAVNPKDKEAPALNSRVLIPKSALKKATVDHQVFYLVMIRDIYALVNTTTNT